MPKKTDTPATEETLFVITGGFDVSKKLKKLYDSQGVVRGFETEDGREVRLVMALEIETFGKGCKYITSEAKMDKLGFSNLSYKDLNFYPQEG